MLIEQCATGGDRNFGYLVADREGGRGALIDPSYRPEALLGRAGELNVAVDYIFLTHLHADHTAEVSRAERAAGLRRRTFADGSLSHGARLPLGELEVLVLHTPGHTPDSVCLLAGDALFTGDTLFVGKVGGTGTGSDARDQFESLHRIILALPERTRIFPGHDYGTSPQSTVGEEKSSNPFLLCEDLRSFLLLKENWPAYKRTHGIL